MSCPDPTPAGGLLAGVDVGGSKIAVVLSTPDLELVARHTIETGVGDAGYAVNRIVEAIEADARDVGRDATDLRGDRRRGPRPRRPGGRPRDARRQPRLERPAARSA